jgi:steroid delta-isomerase-like uncharacterized protein
MTASAQENKAVVRRFLEEAWNERNFDLIDELVAPDARHHDPTDPPDLPPGPEGEKQLLQAQQSAAPDARIEIQDMLAEGDEVATRWTVYGTHEGEFMGIEPTGNEIEIDGIQIDRIEDGQIVEKWVLYDALGLLQQMGAGPERPPA